MGLFQKLRLFWRVNCLEDDVHRLQLSRHGQSKRQKEAAKDYEARLDAVRRELEVAKAAVETVREIVEALKTAVAEVKATVSMEEKAPPARASPRKPRPGVLDEAFYYPDELAEHFDMGTQGDEGGEDS